MSSLVTITSKFYDESGRRVISLNVKSRYKGSIRENLQKTDDNGLFVFQASSNRIIEILAKPPNANDYTVFKTINSSIVSSDRNPIKVQLPKTIEEYKKGNVKQPASGTVFTLFKVVDSTGKVMFNFPIQSRPKGKKTFERSTNKEGVAEIESSPNREIEILVLTSNDKFVLKKSVNSGNGSKQPILIKLDEPYDSFKSLSKITLLDRNDNNYIIEKTNVEILALDSGEKNIITTSNGKIAVRGHIGKWVKITVYRPDGTPLKLVDYLPKRINESSVKLHLDVDVTNGMTEINEPIINKLVQSGICACNRDITSDEFKKIISSSTASSFLKDLNEQFKKLNMNNCLEKAHFIAHTLHETAGYSLLEEGLGGKPESSVYDGYKGRGLMQITYKKNYEGYGNAINDNFLGNNKHRIAKERQHAVGSAIWYWQNSKAGNLTPHALKNDLIATCALINGGYNGFNEREGYYKKAVLAFNIKECSNLDKNIIDRLDQYTDFENSYIYRNKVGECFGWGLWNDPISPIRKKKGRDSDGKTNDVTQAKKGYKRFLELTNGIEFPFGYELNKQKQKISRKRYGYSADRAKAFANKRLEEL